MKLPNMKNTSDRLHKWSQVFDIHTFNSSITGILYISIIQKLYKILFHI